MPRTYLKNQLHVVGHGYSVTVGQGKDLVVVQYGVKILDPDGVNRAIADNPLLQPSRVKTVGKLCILIVS